MYVAGARVAPSGSGLLLWASIGLFMMLPIRMAASALAVVLLGYGALLAVQPGNALPGVRWELMAGACIDIGVSMAWLVRKLRRLQEAEQGARIEVEHSMDELEHVSRHKSEFLANMSHELRSPLNAVIGFAEVLDDELFGPLTVKQAAYVQDIADAGRQLLGLINDVLDLAKVEAGGVELALHDVAVADVIRETLDEHATEARERRVTFGVTIAPDVTTVAADRARLRRAVGSLVSNAVRFSPEGSCVDVRAARSNGEVVLAVRDRGPGIATADQARIFEEFQHVGPADRAAPGPGLGLALARSFAELHGGRLEVESEPGQGSTFRLAIPQPS
jgi:signal transduction histidine kinase